MVYNDNRSHAERIAADIACIADDTVRANLLGEYANLNDFDGFWLRPTQFPPDEVSQYYRDYQCDSDRDWAIWLIQTGRGWGKTKAAARWLHRRVRSGKARRIALVARTPKDYRETMIEGETGLLATADNDFRPRYISSHATVEWPNGATAICYSSAKPDSLRGPNFDTAWCDELASWYYLDDVWAMLSLCVRLGTDPRIVITTTPRPVALLKELGAAKTTVVTQGSTYENISNLAPQFIAAIQSRYEGTHLGAQEIEGRLLDEMPGALWKRAYFRHTFNGLPTVYDGDIAQLFVRLGVRKAAIGVDPSVTRDGNECGIVSVGIDSKNYIHVVADRSLRGSPQQWAIASLDLYDDSQADALVAEVNQGGELVRRNLEVEARSRKLLSLPYVAVSASRGKRTRAEPVVSLYEQGKVIHWRIDGVARNSLITLEDQLCAWQPSEDDDSPDRLDALVWAITYLAVDRRVPNGIDIGSATRKARAENSRITHRWKV